MEFAEGEPRGTCVDLYFPRAAVTGGGRELVERFGELPSATLRV